MGRVTTTFMLFSGFLLLISGLLLHNAVPTQAQDDDDREYLGVRECNDCHRDLSREHALSRHGLTLMEVEGDAEPDELGFMLGDFTLGEDVRTVNFPDGERAFGQADVAFTLGAGLNYQAYITSLEEDTYTVLPAMWDAKEGTWIPLDRAETWPDAAYDFGQQCAGCHTVGLSYDADDGVYEWQDDGVQCEACHGPGSLHVDLVDDAGRDISGAEYLEFAAALDDATDAQVCGACHVRGIADDGIHPYPIDYRHGEALTASFTPYPTDDTEHWYASGYAAMPNMQYNEWSLSGHASSLNTVLGSSAAETACLMCHSTMYRMAQAVLIDGDISDPVAFETAPLILDLLDESGLPPSKQKIVLESWLPLVLSAMDADTTPEATLEDVVLSLFDFLDLDEDDYDPEAALLPQFMPQLAEFLLDAQEDAAEGDTDDLDELNALMAQLVPLLIDDIESKQVSADVAVGETMVAQADHFGVTCAACHNPHPGAPRFESDEDEADTTTTTVAETTYALCTSCHQNTALTETVHHPVVEMFEGQDFVDGIVGVPSTHFSETDGPRCSTCHMSNILVSTEGIADEGLRANHTWNPVTPDDDPDAPASACSNCHTDLSAGDMRSLIEDTQSSIQSRMSLAWARVASLEIPEPDTEAFARYNQAVKALQFVQNDGSQGVHNYAYTDALIDTSNDLLSQLSVPGSDLDPTEAPAPTATPSPETAVTFHQELPATSAMRPITLIVIVGAVLLLFLGGIFIARRARQSTSEQE